MLKNLAKQSISVTGYVYDMVRQFAYDPVDSKDQELNWYTIGSDLGAVIRLALGFKV